MGTDIHMYAEVREPGGPWRKVGHVWPNPDYREGDSYFGQERFKRPTDQPYDWRNYSLFAILANVRNGSGFAGVKLGDGFNPISEPRGLPSDLSPELARAAANDYTCGEYGNDDYIYLGDHSFTWLTLKELQGFDWMQKTRQCGVISWAQYLEHRKGTQPASYCGDTWSQGSITIEEDQAERGKPEGYEPNKVNVRVYWTNSYRAAVGSHFFDETLPRLAALGEPENVRIVFGFDS